MGRSASATKKKTSRVDLVPLTREVIVRAALALADKDGLHAVSLRNVASALDAGPMRLYGHVEDKEELLALMVDEVYGELSAPTPGDWRAALRSIAEGLRAAARRHPWFIGLLGGRPHLGANAFAYMEASLASLGGVDVDDAIGALRLVKAYAIGAIQSEASDLGSGMNQAEWQTASWPYVEQMISTGNFPMIAKVVRDAKHPQDTFERGLETVLDGLAKRLG
ncbi:TetR/AcrR family transcriptional regulator C-terminal domain-containing protein [Polyangium sp. 6x1]|uniref:TetR/AcrR family transcriptional regulator n=1 Tax=Polyangium sp. 6x1 TaxID=3042689 RepID=UPI002482E2FA|nr:TetR/AcrR family transcriptional regulator C-terminal domain-containing protein [Polyangium sp. 6x1]MDI1446783.1 TetR/AcrR family transcriptional regulator C-terminal domain-containing protein [Polyangium sp. 6x1]